MVHFIFLKTLQIELLQDYPFSTYALKTKKPAPKKGRVYSRGTTLSACSNRFKRHLVRTVTCPIPFHPGQISCFKRKAPGPYSTKYLPAGFHPFRLSARLTSAYSSLQRLNIESFLNGILFFIRCQ